jgi:carbon-monoxide dehydrogenase large subunit
MDALSPFGIAHLDMPLTAPKVWQAIQSSRATAATARGSSATTGR